MNSECVKQGDQWFVRETIDLDPQWRIMFRNPTRNYADLTKTLGGTQWEPAPIYGQERLTKIAQRILNQHQIPRTITNTWRSWCIKYDAGGYQEPHKHGAALITSVLYFDDDDSETVLELDREYRFPSRRGQFLLFDGLTTHWGTTVKNSKRVLVTDWEFREFDAEGAAQNFSARSASG